jgi:predicted transglutaminase-like cysteine proteinase
MSVQRIVGIILSILVTFTFVTAEANARSHRSAAFKHYSMKKQSHKIKRRGAVKFASNSHRVRRGGVLPPFAYIQFCTRNPKACRTTAGRLAMASGKVKLSKKLKSQMASINSRVNSSMIARADRGADRWVGSGRYGDCEDFALRKRSMLIAAGWPSGALALTVVKTSSGEGHAVLSVRTSQGTLVLDNLSRSVRGINQTSYRVVAMQGRSAMSWSR